MSNPQPEIPQLSEPDEITSEATFDMPSILLLAKIEGGHLHHAIREGRPRQVEMITRTEWAEQPVDESANVFAVRAQNVINFAKQRLSVINDETTLDEKHYPPTAPTASEYLALVGQRVMIHFDCTRDIMESKRLDRPVYKIVRNTIVLP